MVKTTKVDIDPKWKQLDKQIKEATKNEKIKKRECKLCGTTTNINKENNLCGDCQDDFRHYGNSFYGGR